MSETKKLYLAKGRLSVEAKGYWFTSGGEKGSFGYYPHLKDKDGCPVFPDTQVHGDLRMSAAWLSELGGADTGLMRRIFGDDPKKEHRSSSGHIFITDLELTKESRKLWGRAGSRFQVKSRIEIDDTKRTVREHMLVDLEMAYLEGLTLEADVYLGYFDDAETLMKAKSLVKEAALFLSGFGAFRSRGYGRHHSLCLTWDADTVVEAEVPADNEARGDISYRVRSLVNLRNRPVFAGSTQVIESYDFISSGQIRGWFIKAYHSLFGVWPTPGEMIDIIFTHLYPACETGFAPSYPAALTTMKNEEGRYMDGLNRKSEESEEEKKNREGFFMTKTKPVRNAYVTQDDNPVIFSTEMEKRIRNSIKDNFTTLDKDGLFVQELVRRGTVFSGTVSIKESASSGFSRRTAFLLKTAQPIINGCLFSIDAVECSSEGPSAQETASHPLLLTSPVVYQREMINYRHCHYAEQDGRVTLQRANMVTVSVNRRFNTMLGRQRRPRIVIAAGSVLYDAVPAGSGTIPWKGFGGVLQPAGALKRDEMPDKQTSSVVAAGPAFAPPAHFNDLKKKMTRSQAGMLRELLNEKRAISEVRAVIADRVAKYEAKGESAKGFKALFSKIEEHALWNDGGNAMRAYVNFILDELFDAWWRKER